MIQKFRTLIGLDRCTRCLCSHGMQELEHGHYGENAGRGKKKTKKTSLCVSQLCSLQPLHNYWINEECSAHPWL